MNGVSQITVTEDVALITFNKAPAHTAFLADLFDRCAQAKLNIDMISQTAPQGNSINISFTIRGADLIHILALLKEFKAQNPSLTPMVSNGNCKIQLYGEEMRRMYGVASKAIRTVSGLGVELTLITTSEVDISFLVSQAQVEDVVNALKQAFES